MMNTSNIIFDNGPHCAFANIANLLHYNGDIEGANEFYNKLTAPFEELFDENESDIKEAKRHCRIELGIQYLRKLGYNLVSIRKVTDMIGYKQSEGFCGALFTLKYVKVNTLHVVATSDGKLIDGSNDKLLYLTSDNLDWCCRTNDQYVVFHTKRKDSLFFVY